MRGECCWSDFVGAQQCPGHEGAMEPSLQRAGGYGDASGDCLGGGADPLDGQGGCGMQHP